MDTHGNKNFNKLAFILLDPVTKQLRYIFRQEWDNQHPSNPWQNDNNSLLYLKTEARQHGATWNRSTAPKAGDPDEWDPTNLFYVLLNSNTISLPTAHNQHVHKLRDIRNKYAHPSKASINDTDFEAIYQDIEKCMIGLNCSSSVQKQMEDIKKGILKVPEDYLKEVSEKLDIIFILHVVVSVIVSMIFIYLLMLYLHPGYDHIDLSRTTTCNNSRIFFPESRKPRYYIGHDREINTGATVLVNDSCSMVSITGPPAIGKSATAVAVGKVLKNNHGYQVAFVDFKQINVSSSHIRTDIYKHIVLAIDYELENVSDSLQKFIMIMKKITTCSTLLLFDNIENILNSISKAIFYEVTKICLEINKIKVLTTSRKEFDIIGVAIHPIKLEPLPKSQSTGLLVSLLPELQQKSLVKKIAEKTGGIPLLLEVAASLVRSKYYEQYELLNRLEELPILVVLNDTKDMTESSNYYKLLKIVFDGLDQSVQLVFIAFGMTPVFLDPTSADALVNFNFSEKANIHPLVDYNLLKTFDLPSGQRLYGMHPIISEFTRLLVEDNPHWLKMQNTQCRASVVATSPQCESLSFIIADYSDMTFQQPIWENVGKVPKILVHNRLTERDERRLGIEIVSIGLEFYKLGQYTKCTDFLLPSCEKTKDDTDILLLKCLALCSMNAWLKYLKKGNLCLSTEFSNLLLKTLKWIKRDPCFVATRLLDLGTMSNSIRFHKDAAVILEQALTNYQQQYQQQNCSKENLGSLALKIGRTFYNRGKYHASINALLMSANLLKSHDAQLEADWILADSYYKTQDYETCFQIVRRVLNSSYEVDYQKQKYVFQALTGLSLKAAYTYLNQSNIAMTIHFSNLSLNTLKRLETDSCLVSSLYFEVGIMFYTLHMSYRHAAFAFNQTWTFKKKNKCDDISLGLVAYYLGGAYYHCGQYNDSIDVLCIAVGLLEKDDERLFMANCLLASSYYEIKELERGLEITRNILSNNSYLNTLNSSLFYEVQLMNLTAYVLLAATKYHNQGKLNQSIEFYNLAIATLEMADAQPCSIASVYFKLGITLSGAQRHGDAAFALTKALEFNQRNGCDEKQVGVTAFYIGASFYEIGQYRKSIEVLLEKIDLLKKNPDLEFEANYFLVFSYLWLQDYENSFQLLSKVLNSPHVDNLRCKQKLEIMKRLAREYLQTQNANESTKYCHVYMYTFISIIFSFLYGQCLY